MNKISGIYKIESKLKPKHCYIGSAVSINQRWAVHLCLLQKNKHSNKKLQNHYNKYGESDLQFSVLLGCEKETLLKTEQYFLDSYKPYFNICVIAGSNLGRKFSDECKEKNRQAHKGKPCSEETRKKISLANKGHYPWSKGKKVSAEKVAKMFKFAHGNQYSKGLKHSNEHKSKISESLKGRVPWNKGKEMSELIKQKLRKPQSIETRIKKSIAHTGMKFTEEHKRRISEANKGSNNAMFGKHHTKESCLKISKANKERI
jgi:hypothetical protein